MMLSSHILINLPFPGIQVNLDWIKHATALHNFQIGDPLPSSNGWSKHLFLLPWRYFLNKTCFHQSNCPVIRCHKTFTPSAMFIRVGSFIPRPPLSLGHRTVFQLIRWNILVSFPTLPQEFVDFFHNLLHYSIGCQHCWTLIYWESWQDWLNENYSACQIQSLRSLLLEFTFDFTNYSLPHNGCWIA